MQNNGFTYAQDVYASLGVDVHAAMDKAACLPISLHCWQGDDVMGFDGQSTLDGGIATTGNYPYRATTPAQLRQDLETAMDMIPGTKKVNLHASYAEKGNARVDRDTYSIAQFQNWADWAKARDIGLDFNPTFFSHPMMDGNFSLSSSNEKTRRFFIEHGKRCREIGSDFAKITGKPCVINHWMPDGYKDIAFDTAAPRARMLTALDEVFAQDHDGIYDAIESKLFGLGVESYTVCSHEFSMGYAISRKKLYCMDAGHFHPTEVISAKLSAVLCYLEKALLHVSRPVRWDSDHVILLDDELQAIMNEVVRGGYENRIFVALDYFDASINRVAAWVIGVRNAQKALLKAYLEPTAVIKTAEQKGDYTSRLALLEQAKTLPFAPIWDAYCQKNNVPTDDAWLAKIKQYEKDVQSVR